MYLKRHILITRLILDKVLTRYTLYLISVLVILQLSPIIFGNTITLQGVQSYYKYKAATDSELVTNSKSFLSCINNLIIYRILYSYILKPSFQSVEDNDTVKQLAIYPLLCNSCKTRKNDYKYSFLDCEICKHNLKTAFYGYYGKVNVYNVKGFNSYNHPSIILKFSLADYFYKLIAPSIILLIYCLRNFNSILYEQGFYAYLSNNPHTKKWIEYSMFFIYLSIVAIYFCIFMYSYRVILVNKFIQYSPLSGKTFSFEHILFMYPSIWFFLITNSIIYYIENCISRYKELSKLVLLFITYCLLIRLKKYETYILYQQLPNLVVNNSYYGFKLYQQDLLNKSARILVLTYTHYLNI